MKETCARRCVERNTLIVAARLKCVCDIVWVLDSMFNCYCVKLHFITSRCVYWKTNTVKAVTWTRRVQGLKLYCDENHPAQKLYLRILVYHTTAIVKHYTYYQFTLTVEHVIIENSRKHKAKYILFFVLYRLTGVYLCQIKCSLANYGCYKSK